MFPVIFDLGQLFSHFFLLLMSWSPLIEVLVLLAGTWLNRRNTNLQFLFILLLVYQTFDYAVLTPYMRVIKPFYLEHIIEATFGLMVCFVILGRAKIAGWCKLNASYIGYMQDFGLFAIYIGFTLLSLALFAESVLYWFTDVIAKPLPVRSVERYAFVTLNVIEIYILCSLTRQNLTNKLPTRYTMDC